MDEEDYAPGTAAPQTGLYEGLNIFGSPSGSRVWVAEGDRFPAAPVGFKWRLVPDLLPDRQ
jgi:hypothetical protein